MEENPSTEEKSSPLWRSMSRAEINDFVRSLVAAFEVLGVQRKRGRIVLDPVDDPGNLMLDFSPRVHSPKKFLFPNWEKLFRFRVGSEVLLEGERASAPRVIFGMHPCDLHAVRVLDDCLFDGEADSAYRAKREASILVGVDCEPDDHCFCASLGTDRVADGFDLFFHRVEEGYLVQAGTARARKLLQRHAPLAAARAGEPPLPLQVKRMPARLRFPVESLPNLLGELYDHPVWQELGERCLGCGACTLLCPTCYCFNVQDKLDLDLESGERLRTWDSCQFDQFTRVSGGDDFRSNQADRQRHRFFRKYKYLWDKHKRTACVGCGRCSRECLAGIRPVEVLNGLFRDRGPAAAEEEPGAEYRPQLAEILAVQQLTAQDKLFRLSLPESFDFTPGTFVEVSVFGLGEAPFTIASEPGCSSEIDLVVRAAGSLTRALHRLQPGDTVGVRGPFGRGFALDQFRGWDVLLVAGGLGMVTLRSLLLTILSRREDFGRVVLLYGARNTASFLFRDDLRRWHREGLLDCRLTTDEPDAEWGLPQGDVTHLFRDLDINAVRSVAAVSGPASMYRFTNPLLFRLGFDEGQLYLNLERHMKCGLGKCGKCRINDLCVCECGPIFSYSRVRHLLEAIER